jgi:hypothetical protein
MPAMLRWNASGDANGNDVVSLLEIEDGKISRFWAYFDARSFSSEVVSQFVSTLRLRLRFQHVSTFRSIMALVRTRYRSQRPWGSSLMAGLLDDWLKC